MRIGPHRFDQVEFAGSLGDLGTLLPLSVALITINGLSFTTVFLLVGIFYIACGLYFRLPVPVQPLKVVSAIAIAFPEKVTLPVISATGLIFGGLLILMAVTGVIDRLARLFTKPIVRGIQLGLGFILAMKGIGFIQKPELFLLEISSSPEVWGVPVNLLLGLSGVVVVLFFLSSRRFPAALLLLALGIAAGLSFGSFQFVRWEMGPTEVRWYIPGMADCLSALVLLVIPQIPLTIGNAVIGTADTARCLFGPGEPTERATYRSFSLSMGLANLLAGATAGMPVCHGAGGLAAHYRFGARTGGSNVLIGLLFCLVAVLFGKAGVSLFSAMPNAVFGVFLLFAGLELAVLVRDLKNKDDLFVAFLIAGIGLATANMSVAFGCGIAVSILMRRGKIQI